MLLLDTMDLILHVHDQMLFVIGIRQYGLFVQSRYNACIYNNLQLGLGLAFLSESLLVAVVEVLPKGLCSLRTLELQSAPLLANSFKPETSDLRWCQELVVDCEGVEE